MPDGRDRGEGNRQPQWRDASRAPSSRGARWLIASRRTARKNLQRFRVRTPTFANLPAMLKLLQGCDLADVPVLVLTIDPCISCTER